MEKLDFADTQYDWVKFRGGYLRAITRKPKGRSNLPAILLVPGYGCGSIENYAMSYNGKLLFEWVKAGYAVITVEKSGMGDSYDCVPCSEADLVNEIESFDAGYQYMEQLPFVDKKQLFIWGHSMGGVVAPEIAKRHEPKGVMVFACTFRPWSEFLLEMHRVQKPLLENFTYQQTEDFVRRIQKVYYEFFVLKKSPEQLYNIPEYKELAVSDLNYAAGSNNMWGRHWRYWMQLDSLNMADTWKQVNAPVLIIHGGADYEQCSFVEPMMINETVNAAHPGNATWTTIPDIDHFMMKSNSWKEAASNFKTQQYLKGNFNYKIAEETLRWLKKQ
jgi:pimeloyl-ACP methyl ester carboxylesterase